MLLSESVVCYNESSYETHHTGSAAGICSGGLFMNNRRQNGMAAVLCGTLLLLLFLLPGSGLADDWLNTDRYVMSDNGYVSTWTHYDYDAAGNRIRETESRKEQTAVTEYDGAGNTLKKTVYDVNGRIKEYHDFSYSPAGLLTVEKTTEYTGENTRTEYKYYDYDQAGRQTALRLVDNSGAEGIRETYEYGADGSWKMTTYQKIHTDSPYVSAEIWYNSSGKETRAVSYHENGSAAMERNTEYIPGTNKVLRTETKNDQEGVIYREEYFYDENGKRLYSESWQRNDRYRHENELNGDGKIIASLNIMLDENGNEFNRYIYHENEYGEYGCLLSQRSYTVNGRTDRERYPVSVSYYAYENAAGERITPAGPLQRDTMNSYQMTPGAFRDTFRNMTREDAVNRWHARQISECIYDSGDTFWYYGFPGSIRFVFEGRSSDLLRHAYWYCEDFSADLLNGLIDQMEDDGVNWSIPRNITRDPLGMNVMTAYYDGLQFMSLAFSDEAEDGTMQVYIYAGLPDVNHYGYAPGDRMQETLQPAGSAAVRTDGRKAQGTIPHPQYEQPATDSGEEAPAADTAAASEPEPEQQNSAAMTEEETADWTGYWMTGDSTNGELVITSDGSGRLHMQVFFLGTFDMEADLKRPEGSSCTFETAYGHYSGVLTRSGDGGMRFTVTGGMSMEDDENELYYFFHDREYVFSAADYDDLWYETPATGPEDDADWLGEWTAQSGEMSSRIRIIRSAGGDYIMQLSFSGGYAVAGPLEKADSRRMDFYTDDFSAMLTLNRKKHAILMSEIGSMSDEVYRWLDDVGLAIAYYAGETADTAAVPKTENAPADEWVPAYTEPSASADETAAADEWIPAYTDTSAADAALIPIAGRAGYMQVPIAQADATSYIVGKDPTAYIPYRMTDGVETTAYQFSIKDNPLGNAYLYFTFDTPSALDELWMKNGFWKKTDGKDQYDRNCRVKSMTVEFSYAGDTEYHDPVQVFLPDDKERKDWFTTVLGRRTNVTGIRIRIDDIYTGSKFKYDVCISEIMFVKRTDSE